MLQILFKFLIRFVLLYGFLVTYHMGHGLTSRYLSLFVSVLIILYRREKLDVIMNSISKRKIKISFLLFFSCSFILLASYALLPVSHYSTHNVYIEWWHFPYQMFFVLVFSIYCAVEYDTFSDFLYTWLFFIVIEAFLIYAAVVNDSLRMFLYAISYVGDGRFDSTIEAGTRIMGLGIYASDGSLTMSTGVIALIFLKLRNKINDICFFVCNIIIFSATMFIGRTGVLVEIFLMISYVILSRRMRFSIIWFLLAIMVVPLMISFLLGHLSMDSSDHLMEWMLGAFSEEDQIGTLQTATRSGLQMNEYFLFGNGGLMRGTFDGYRYNSDSGYLKMLTAIGVIGSCCYYLGMLCVFLSIKIKLKQITDLFPFLVIFVAFVIEIKEPYFMKLRIPWFVYTVLLLNAIDLKKITYKNMR